jgi:hypothetical protein
MAAGPSLIVVQDPDVGLLLPRRASRVEDGKRRNRVPDVAVCPRGHRGGLNVADRAAGRAIASGWAPISTARINYALTLRLCCCTLCQSEAGRPH